MQNYKAIVGNSFKNFFYFFPKNLYGLVKVKLRVCFKKFILFSLFWYWHWHIKKSSSSMRIDSGQRCHLTLDCQLMIEFYNVLIWQQETRSKIGPPPKLTNCRWRRKHALITWIGKNCSSASSHVQKLAKLIKNRNNFSC